MAFVSTGYRFVRFDLADSAGIDKGLAPALEDLNERRPASVCLLDNAATVDAIGRLDAFRRARSRPR